MRKSCLLRVSLEWKEHCDHIKHLIALGTSEKKYLEQARTYIHSLDLKSFETLNDVIELTSLLPKVEYPFNSQVTHSLKAYAMQRKDTLTAAHIQNITSFLQLSQDSLIFFLTCILGTDAVLAEFEEALESMKLGQIVELMNVVSKRDGVTTCLTVNPKFIKVLSCALLSAIESTKDSGDAILLLMRCDFPIWKYVKGLPRCVEKLYCATSAGTMEDIVRSINTSKKNSREWAAILQQLMCRSFDGLDFSVDALLFEKLCSLNVPVKEALWLDILSRLDDAPLNFDAIEALCINFEGSRCNKSDCKKKVEMALKRKLITLFQCPEISFELRIRCLMCHAYISHHGMKEIFSKVQLNKADFTPASVVFLCKFLCAIGWYPKNVVKQLHLTSDFNQEDCIYLLNAVHRAGLPVLEDHLQHALGASAYRKFVSRKGKQPYSLSSKNAVLLLSVLSELDTKKYDPKFFPITTILRADKLSLKNCLQFLSSSIRFNNNLSLSTIYLQAALSRSHECDCVQLGELFASLSSLRVREAVVFTKLIRIGEAMNPNVNLALSAAKAAHALKLTTLFAEASLVKSLTDLSQASFDVFTELLAYSSQNQRDHLVRLSAARQKKYQYQLDRIDTGTLLVLSNTLLAPRGKVLEIIKCRPAMKSSDCTSEEVVLSLECARGEGEVDLILRIGSACLNDLDDRQLMRVHRCLYHLRTCPNIAFRILGRNIIRNIKSFSVDEALLWLNLYVHHGIRDDSVGKILVKKAAARTVWSTREIEEDMKQGAKFFGASLSRATHQRERSTSYFTTTL